MRYLFPIARFALPVALFGMFPLLSFAATYHYVDTSGVVRSVEAPNAETAISIAPNRDPHSGVAIDRGLLEAGMTVSGTGSGSYTGTGGSNTWHYVTNAGFTASVTAPDAATALSRAANIDPHSGVAIDEGMIENGEFVPAAANQ